MKIKRIEWLYGIMIFLLVSCVWSLSFATAKAEVQGEETGEYSLYVGQEITLENSPETEL